MKVALDHHHAHNRHHPEFFSPEPRPAIDYQRHADGDIYRSLQINKDRFQISAQLLEILANTIPWIQDEFTGYSTQADLFPGLADKQFR